MKIVKNINETIYYDDDDKYHREDGPAVISSNGDKYWYIHGKLHREDGPAIDLVDDFCGWYIDDKLITTISQENFEKKLKLKAFW